jgi:hypothetical protein
MDSERLIETQRVVGEVARKWVRGRPWALHLLSDVLQEATLAVLQAEKLFNPARGDWASYAAGAALLALRRFVWRNRGPIAPPRPERGGVRAIFVRGELAIEEALGHAPPHDLEVHRRRALEQVAGVLKALDTSKRKLGFAVVVKEEEPAVVARRARVPVRAAYYARKTLTRRAAQSDELRALHQELDT